MPVTSAIICTIRILSLASAWRNIASNSACCTGPCAKLVVSKMLFKTARVSSSIKVGKVVLSDFHFSTFFWIQESTHARNMGSTEIFLKTRLDWYTITTFPRYGSTTWGSTYRKNRNVRSVVVVVAKPPLCLQGLHFKASWELWKRSSQFQCASSCRLYYSWVLFKIIFLYEICNSFAFDNLTTSNNRVDRLVVIVGTKPTFCWKVCSYMRVEGCWSASTYCDVLPSIARYIAPPSLQTIFCNLRSINQRKRAQKKGKRSAFIFFALFQFRRNQCFKAFLSLTLQSIDFLSALFSFSYDKPQSDLLFYN